MRCRKDDKCDRKKAENLRLCPGISKEDAFKDAPPVEEPKPEQNPNNDPCNELKGPCKTEQIGMWNCAKGNSYQRCASGAWNNLAPLPAGTSCTCGLKDRSWDPANPGSPQQAAKAVSKSA